MSGGSFEYVYIDVQDPEWAYRAQSKLRDMKAYCEGAFPDAVIHIDGMLQFIEAFNEVYLEKGMKLVDLLKAIEWYASSDWGKDSIQKALDELTSDNKDSREDGAI